MPTLEEMIEAAKNPESWYKDVLDEVVNGIQEEISRLLGGSGSIDMILTGKYPRIEKHQERLEKYLANELQADVRMTQQHDQRDGTMVKVEVARKGYFAALTQSYWEK